MNKHTTFQQDWLTDPMFMTWLLKDPHRNENTVAFCKLCKKTINLSNMGRRALTSHMEGEKHKKIYKSVQSSASLYCFTKKPGVGPNIAVPQTVTHCDSTAVTGTRPTTVVELREPSSSTQCDAGAGPSGLGLINRLRGISSFLLNDNVCKAEILWTIQSVMTHKSLRTTGSDTSLFSAMFPDSEIAKKMQLQRDKVGYMIVYGIAPFFKQELLKKVETCEYFVIGFDESMNKVAQKQQMDLNVRFWDDETNEVCTRYLNSVFLGHTTAMDILKSFKEGLQPLNLKKILQVSMDGPNVNHKFLRELKKDLSTEPDEKIILDLGSCGLHTLHGAFKTAMKETGWEIITFLRALYNLFKESPARRAMYTAITGSSTFPKKFCAIRWVENITVAQRALEILPNLKTFVDEINKTKPIESYSYNVLKDKISDVLLPAKLEFFKSVAGDVEPFLRQFQSDDPLAPFLFADLTDQVKVQMAKIIVPSVLDKTDNTKLQSIELVNKNLLPAKSINLGIATKSAIRKANDGQEKISDLVVLRFREDCKKGLIKFIMKIQERSPLQFKLTKAVSSLDPKVCFASSSIAKNRMETLLTILLENNWASEINVDQVMREFDSLLKCPKSIESLKAYSRTERLDHFWFKLLKSEKKMQMLKVAKMVMTFSHGNANVERGFSINAECIVENMREELLISQRFVYDKVSSLGGIEKLSIDKSLILSAKNAYSKFKEAKERKKRLAELEETDSMKKRKATQLVKELEAKKFKLLEEAERQAALLNEEIESLKQ